MTPNRQYIRTTQDGQDEDNRRRTIAVPSIRRGGMIIKCCEEQEVRIENRKIKVPVRLSGEESDREKATSFHTCAGKSDTEAAHISAVGRVSHLADHSNAGMILTHSNSDLNDCYMDQLVDPSKWEIKSFHGPTGTVVANTVRITNPQVYKPMCDDTNNTAVANHHGANIQYV